MFVLDTDHWTILELQSGDDYKRLVARIKAHSNDEFFVSIVTLHEVVNGWLKYVSKSKGMPGVVRGYERLEFLFKSFETARVLPFDNAAAEVFSEMRSNRVRVSTMDLRIASIAIANHLTVLTRNTVDFERVPGLQFDDWLK